jgi:hypothetical protein
MAPEPKVEERDVGKDEIKSGVKLQPGHKVVIIVGGSGNPPQDDPRPDSPDEHEDKPGEPAPA